MYFSIFHCLFLHLDKEQILDSIRSNQVTIICGETGSGKTTRKITLFISLILSLRNSSIDLQDNFLAERQNNRHSAT
jgi:HrpA-like RNA helicase